MENFGELVQGYIESFDSIIMTKARSIGSKAEFKEHNDFLDKLALILEEIEKL